MKKLLVLLISFCIVFGVTGCSESQPKCVHENTKTTYEISGLSIKKIVTCTDCEENISDEYIDKLRYVYNKVLVDESGIKCTLLNIEIDGWSTVTMNFEVEGTSSNKRTFSVEKMYVNGYDAAMWLYVSDLSNNKKSLESDWLNNVKAEDFIENQTYEIEIDYTILDSNSYTTLAEKDYKFNLNEFTSIEEVKSK